MDYCNSQNRYAIMIGHLSLLHYKKSGFGDHFLSLIKSLYCSPSACVRTNDPTSPRFLLQRGYLSGLFTLPLSFCHIYWGTYSYSHIWFNNNISRIKTLNVIHKISLYADDVLLFLLSAHICLSETVTLNNTK